MDAVVGDVLKITGASGTVSHFVVLACDDGIATGLILTNRNSSWAISIVCGEMMYADPRRVCWKNLYMSEYELVRTITEDELQRFRGAVANALGISALRIDAADDTPREETAAIMSETIEAAGEQAAELIRARERAEVYKGLYEDLLSKVMRKRRDG